MIKFNFFVGIIASALLLAACEEDTYGIGTSLTNETDKLDLEAHTFQARSRTMVADSVLSQGTTCYLGKVKDPETNTYITSEFTSKLHLLETLYVSPEDSVTSRDSNGKVIADSCDIVLFIAKPFKAKDSLTAMKMRVHELSQPIADGQTYYSNFDPTPLIRQGGLSKSKMFTYSDLTESDSVKSLSTYLHNIRMTLNEPYTDKAGVTYGENGEGSGYGTYLLRSYYEHPEYFKNSFTFAENLCPGFFFEIVDGLGFHAQVTDIGLRIYYRMKSDTVVYNGSLTLAGTEEILKTNRVTNDAVAMHRLADDQSCTYLKTPAGLFTEVTLPVDEIKEAHVNDSLIAAKIVFQRLNNEVQSEQALSVPAELLMVEKDSVWNFFEQKKTIDKRATYSASYSTANTYEFNNISSLVTQMWQAKQKGLAVNSRWVEEHPDWNKVVLVPITEEVSSSSGVTTAINNSMALTSTRLVGGQTPIDVHVVYAKFKSSK